jgi:hypothetical protein
MTPCEKNNDVSVSAKTRLTSVSTPQKPIKRCQKVIKNQQKPAKKSKKRQVFALPILTFGRATPSGASANAVFDPPRGVKTGVLGAQIDVSVSAKMRLTFAATKGSSKFKVQSQRLLSLPVPSSRFPVPAVVGFPLEMPLEIRNLSSRPGLKIRPAAMSGTLEKGIA